LDNEIQKAKNRGIRDIILTGGEPGLHEDILSLLRLCSASGIRVKMQSNGRLFTERRVAEEYQQAGLEGVVISIHGHTGQLHDSLTRSPGSFAETVRGIENISKTKIILDINTVMTKQNYVYIDEIIALVYGIADVHKMNLAFPHPCGSALSNFHEVVPAVSRISPNIVMAIKKYTAKGYVLTTESVPLCYLPECEYADTAVLSIAHQEKILMLNIEGITSEENHVMMEFSQMKCKPAQCRFCSLNQICGGLWKEYAAVYGHYEPIPVPGRSVEDVIQSSHLRLFAGDPFPGT
jgi:cyclic pyranopterin phosphate synthase